MLRKGDSLSEMKKKWTFQGACPLWVPKWSGVYQGGGRVGGGDKGNNGACPVEKSIFLMLIL